MTAAKEQEVIDWAINKLQSFDKQKNCIICQQLYYLF